MPASERKRGGSTKGSRPNNGGARKKVRDDDGRGGVRPGAGRKPDLVSKVQEIDSALLHHRHKFRESDLGALRDALGATLQCVRGMMAEEREWDEAEVL